MQRPVAFASSRREGLWPQIARPRPLPGTRAGRPSGIIARCVQPAFVGRRLRRRYREMKPLLPLVAALSLSAAALAAPPKAAPSKSPAESGSAPAGIFTPRTVKTTGTVTVEGHKIAYDAVAGTIIVHPKGWDDAAKPQGAKDAIGTADGPPVASMFYVAYFKHG